MNVLPNASNRDKLIADWKSAQKEAATWVAHERMLREQVIEAVSQETDANKSGVENCDIGWGYKLKITHKLDYKLDNANDCEALDKVLDMIERTTEGGKIISERLVKWKPELSLTEYKLLSAANKMLIDRVLTVKPASKSVELVPPKGSA